MRRGRTRRGNDNSNNNKRIYLILVLIAIVIIAVSIISLIIKQDKTNKRLLIEEQIRQEELSKIFEEDKKEIEEVENHIKPSKVKMKIVGNILCENGILKSAYNSEKKEYDFSPMFSNIKDLITDSDITIGNLETNFYNENYTSHNSPRSLINTLKDLKIETINIANNQNLSDGVDGLISTKNALKEAGIDTYGTSISEDDSNILIKDVNGIKIAFLSYITKIDENIKLTDENTKYINIYSEEKVDKDFEYIKEQGAEYICVNIHTGTTQYRLTKEEQDAINNKLVDSGANLIIGTHQYTIGKLEIRQNSDGKNVFIANSMGNIISENSNLGMILEVQLIRSERTGGTILSKVVYTPTYTYKKNNKYEILDIRETIKIYENKDNTIVSKDIYNKLKEELNRLETLIRQ